MASSACFRPTMACFRKARVTIPKLSPTHTRAKIIRFCPTGLPPPDPSPTAKAPSVYLECTDALFVLECSPDLVTEGFREETEDGRDANPLMIVESHDEGDFRFLHGESSGDSEGTPPITIRLDEWYDVGQTIGLIDDGDDDDDDDDDTEEWLWQAYSHQEGDEERELNLPPHIATGKISK